MAKLSQAIAILPDVKSKTDDLFTKSYQLLQKEAVYTGIRRNYQPLEEEGEKLPPESTLVQVNVELVLQQCANQLANLFSAVGVVEHSNAAPAARADVSVDGKVLIPQATVPYLLFLSKKLVDIRTFINKLPVLDPSFKWKFSPEDEAYCADVVHTSRTRKDPNVITKAEATEHHPAQTELIYTDKVVGTWSTEKLSGAIENARKRHLLQKVDTLIAAVKYAKEEANSATAVPFAYGENIAEYIFS